MRKKKKKKYGGPASAVAEGCDPLGLQDGEGMAKEGNVEG
jgi:hypothetical protein